MPPLKCTGKDGVGRTFTYTYVAPSMIGERNSFFVATDPLPASGNRFEMGLEDLDDQNIRITIARHYDEEVYASKGIPEALIPIVAHVLQKNVHSSPGTGDETNVYRLKRATDYWKRTKGATYDEEKDIFTFAKPDPAPGIAAPLAASAITPTAVPPEVNDSEAGHEKHD